MDTLKDGLEKFKKKMMTNNDYIKEILFIKEQLKLEDYQNNRKLTIPNIKKTHICLICILYILLIGFEIVIFSILNMNLKFKIFILAILIILTLEFGLRFIGIMIVKCYQHYASEEIRQKCLCIPSCSEYAILCFKKNCLVKSIYKIRKRLYKTYKGDKYIIDNP